MAENTLEQSSFLLPTYCKTSFLFSLSHIFILTWKSSVFSFELFCKLYCNKKHCVLCWYATFQRRRLCGGSRAQAPTEITLWGLSHPPEILVIYHIRNVYRYILYIYIYIHTIYTHIYMYAHIYIYMYACIYTHTYIYIHTNI